MVGCTYRITTHHSFTIAFLSFTVVGQSRGGYSRGLCAALAVAVHCMPLEDRHLCLFPRVRGTVNQYLRRLPFPLSAPRGGSWRGFPRQLRGEATVSLSSMEIVPEERVRRRRLSSFLLPHYSAPDSTWPDRRASSTACRMHRSSIRFR